MSTTVIDAATPAFDVPPQEVELSSEENKKDGQFDIWASIQEAKKNNGALEVPPPYVHPLLRRSSSFLSQKSLEICTESLGSETGSDGFSDSIDSLSDGEFEPNNVPEEEDEQELCGESMMKELAAVNYHCSINKKSPPRSFPPPLPSISRRDGPCLHMRPRRRNGRLVVHAVPVPSQNYLHCERQDGRLLLSFIETAFEEIYPDVQDFPPASEEDVNYHVHDDTEETSKDVEKEAAAAAEDQFDQHEIVEEEDEVEEEQVEVVDRGTTVEVKVSRQPQPQSGVGSSVKVHKSSLVINKFVVGTPLASTTSHGVEPPEAARRWRKEEEQVLFSSRKMMKRQELLHQVRRCSENKRALLIWEPFCIATS